MNDELQKQIRRRLLTHAKCTAWAYNFLYLDTMAYPEKYTGDDVAYIEMMALESDKMLTQIDEFTDDLINDQVTLALGQAALGPLMEKYK